MFHATFQSPSIILTDIFNFLLEKEREGEREGVSEGPRMQSSVFAQRVKVELKSLIEILETFMKNYSDNLIFSSRSIHLFDGEHNGKILGNKLKSTHVRLTVIWT